ncbi:MAG: hypothetical protein HZB70_00735 [Candidatus Berkelbacteria bacterium]|nr:MAG: hypothetical protein HZB70_00735 [Candidatus Berkelbacteria bacterium]QQG52136.1 MAG: hypothetical protein HY845_02260 [Candidatus Berkelbacteria bacterium]
MSKNPERFPKDWYKNALIAFVIYFVIGALANLLLNYAILHGWPWRISSTSFVTLASLFYLPALIAFGGATFSGIAFFILSIVGEVLVVSIVPFIFLRKKLPKTKESLVAMLVLLLVVFPLVGKILYLPISRLNPYDYASGNRDKTIEQRYSDIPLTVISDKLIERSIVPSKLPKQLEVTLVIDSPVEATKASIDCRLFEVESEGMYRYISGTDEFYTDLNQATDNIALKKGNNEVKRILPVVDIADSPSAATSLNDYDWLSDSVISKDGPYFVECEFGSFYVGDVLYFTDSTKTTDSLTKVNAESLVNPRSTARSLGSMTGKYKNIVIYQTKPYLKSDFR